MSGSLTETEGDAIAPMQDQWSWQLDPLSEAHYRMAKLNSLANAR